MTSKVYGVSIWWIGERSFALPSVALSDAPVCLGTAGRQDAVCGIFNLRADEVIQ